MAGFGFDPFDQFDDQVDKDLFARRSGISHQMSFPPERLLTSMKIMVVLIFFAHMGIYVFSFHSRPED